MSENEELDALTRRMGEINLALQTSHRDPSQERFALLEELDALRDRAARFHEDRDRHRSDEQLKAELNALRTELDRFRRDHTGYMTSMGGGNASPSPGEWVTLAAKSRSDGGVGRIQARIGQIESELARREVDD